MALQNFAISAEKLVELAKKLEASNGGVDDDSLLAADFRFEFPVVSLSREVSYSSYSDHQVHPKTDNLSVFARSVWIPREHVNKSFCAVQTRVYGQGLSQTDSILQIHR